MWIFVLLFVYVLPIFYKGPSEVINVTDPFAVYMEDSFVPDGPGGTEEAIPVLPESTTPAVSDPAQTSTGRPEMVVPGPEVESVEPQNESIPAETAPPAGEETAAPTVEEPVPNTEPNIQEDPQAQPGNQ